MVNIPFKPLSQKPLSSQYSALSDIIFNINNYIIFIISNYSQPILPLNQTNPIFKDSSIILDHFKYGQDIIILTTQTDIIKDSV